MPTESGVPELMPDGSGQKAVGFVVHTDSEPPKSPVPHSPGMQDSRVMQMRAASSAVNGWPPQLQPEASATTKTRAVVLMEGTFLEYVGFRLQ